MTDRGINRADSGEVNPALAKILLRKALQDMHERDGRSTDLVGASVPGVISGATVARWINVDKKRGLAPHEVRVLCEAYHADKETTGYLCLLAEQAKAANGSLVQPREWQKLYRFDMYAAVESAAEEMWTYQPTLVAGLVQTPGYAEAVIREGVTDDAGVADRVRLRMDRQQIIHRQERPAKLRVVLGEAVLHAFEPGSEGMMQEQLANLLLVGQLPNVTIQVMPFKAGPRDATNNGPFNVLQVDGIGRVVYAETPLSATFLQKPEETAPYMGVMTRLQSQALGPDESAEMIAAVQSTI